MTPPVLCTHLPTDSPIVDATTINARITAVAQRRKPGARGHPRGVRPDRVRQYVAHVSPISDVNTIT